MMLVLVLISIALFFIGLGMLIGLGWVMVIFDLITQSGASTDYAQIQKGFKGAKKPKYKLLGLLIMVAAFILFMYSGNRLQ